MLSNLISRCIIFFLWKKSRASNICSIITREVVSGIELQSSIMSNRDPFGQYSSTKQIKLLSSKICNKRRTLTHCSRAQWTYISFNRFFNPVCYLIIFYLLRILIATLAMVGVLRFILPIIPETSRPSITILIADMGLNYFFSSS